MKMFMKWDLKYLTSPPAYFKTILTIITPFVMIAIPLCGSDENWEALWTLYTIIVMAIYWIFECLPLPITSMLPVVLLPLARVASTDEVARNYLNGTNMMFVASLIMAIAVEHSGFHRRLSLHIISIIGTSQKLITLGFMTCTMFLSMWISNTASVALMVPIVDSIADAMFEKDDVDIDDIEKTKKPKERTKEEEIKRNLMLLSCAYAANIGGTGVITGSPPNFVVLQTLDDDYGSKGGRHPLSYATWMAFSVPLMLVNTFMAWVLITIIQRIQIGPEQTSKEKDEKIKSIIMHRKRELGKITPHEIQVVLLFICLIILWFFQSPKFMEGWADQGVFTGTTDRDSKLKIASATPAVFIVALAFILPRDYRAWTSPSPSTPSEALLNWQIVEKRLPWGVIILLGGGFALADMTKKSGLSQYMVDHLEWLKELDPLLISFIIALVSTFVTEVASNTACANILVPILSKMSLSLCTNPLYLMMTCAVCVSYAFMLPVATAPNAIVYSASTLKTSDMMKTGFFLNILCILTTWGAINSYGFPLYGLGEFPDWADPLNEQNCTISIANITSASLPSPLAALS